MIPKREFSETEKQQAKVRLVRLDAEGNPVGESQVLRVEKISFEPSGEHPIMDKQFADYSKTQTITLNNVQLSPEVKEILGFE